MPNYLENAALGFMHNNIGQHLERDQQMLIARCVVFLREKDDCISYYKAERISINALTEAQSAGAACFDLTESTDTMVVVRDTKTREKLAISAAVLLEAVRQFQIQHHPH